MVARGRRPEARRTPACRCASPWPASTRRRVRSIVGGTAVEVYGLDVAALAGVAADIGAPTFAELSEPLEAVPAGASPFAFRTFGPWA